VFSSSRLGWTTLPEGQVVRPRVDHHRQESHRIMDIFATAGAVIEPMSIEEASAPGPP